MGMGRFKAFSDGIIAFLIVIMVLEHPTLAVRSELI